LPDTPAVTQKAPKISTAAPPQPARRRPCACGSGGRFLTAATMSSALTRHAEIATTASVNATPSA
jgi:hypothetical protein